MIDLNKYPKAKEKFIKWTTDKFKLIFPTAELTGKDAEEFAENSLRGNFRACYDFCDENKIFIGISVYEDSVKFSGTIYYNEDFFDTSLYPFRKECEIDTFKQAFEILEKQLSEKEGTV